MANPLISPKFQAKTKSVTTHATEISLGMINTGQIAWDTLADGGPTDPGFDRFFWTARPEFLRDDLANEYRNCYSVPTKDSTSPKNSSAIPPKVANIWLARAQYDWLMLAERDFLMRRHSRIRLEAHAAAVRRGIGHDKGPISRGIIRHIKQIMAVASSNQT